MKLYAARCLALLACAGASLGAKAATTCTISTQGVVFGSYDPTSSTTLTIIGSVSVTCTYTGNGFDAGLGLATGSSGSYANRTLVLGAQKLNYNLYLDTAHTEVFGNGTNGTYTADACFTGGVFSCPSGGSHQRLEILRPRLRNAAGRPGCGRGGLCGYDGADGDVLRKAFFSEEKKQKTFIPAPAKKSRPQCARNGPRRWEAAET